LVVVPLPCAVRVRHRVTVAVCLGRSLFGQTTKKDYSMHMLGLEHTAFREYAYLQ
jgi:hypothetical protein